VNPSSGLAVIEAEGRCNFTNTGPSAPLEQKPEFYARPLGRVRVWRQDSIKRELTRLSEASEDGLHQFPSALWKKVSRKKGPRNLCGCSHGKP
jgi:hypothetical protein